VNNARKLFLTVAAMLAAGCVDNVVAPRALSVVDSTIPGGGATAALTQTDTLRFSFFIDPKKSSTYDLGEGNTITFPVGAVCELTTSSYGIGEWDKPCAISKGSVTINTKAWLDANGYPRVDFDKHVRFVPSKDPKHWVMLTLSDYGAGTFPWSKINYCPSSDAADCVDESVMDSTLVTTTDPITGKLSRRVKHFSGYSLTSGRSTDEL
jgi:hypothetical protein